MPGVWGIGGRACVFRQGLLTDTRHGGRKYLIQLKKVLAVAAIAVAAIAPIKAIAGSDSVSCVSKGRGFNTNSLNDGTFCEVDSETGGKSTAKASSGGSVSADDFMFGKATATSSHGATTEADASKRQGQGYRQRCRQF